MRRLVLCLALAASAVGHAREVSPEALEQGRRNMEIVNKQLGGFVVDKRNPVGVISIVDAQSAVSRDFVLKCMDMSEISLNMAFKYVRFAEGPVDFANLSEARRSAGGNLWVVLTENQHMPNIVSLPEQKTVLVNVTALSVDKPDTAKLESRVAKEISRAICFAFVVRYSSKSGGIMYPVTSLQELDRILVDQIGVDSRAGIDRAAALHFGIKRLPRKTYLDACREGWAPKPKNEYQKAIWEKAYAIPKAPMKIEFDPKKGR